MKKVERYGIYMTPIQEMYFYKYIGNNKIPALNTLTEKERTIQAKNILEIIKKKLIKNIWTY